MAETLKMPNQQTQESAPVSVLDRIAEEDARKRAEIASRYQPVMSIEASIERYKSIEKFVRECMVENVDYGVPPGFAKDAKPFLFKPGAQKLCAFFGYVPAYTIETEIEEWDSQKYGEPLFYYKFRCVLTKDRNAVGEGIGSCNSWETKYRYRNSERVCPECGAGAIIKGKAEFGGGFLCWDKKGGCKAKFSEDDQRITEQKMGKVANPDIADVINTCQKQGEKRAYVEATLSATGASAFFTQDEDTQRPPTRDEEPQRREAPKQQRTKKQKQEEPPKDDHAQQDDVPPKQEGSVPEELKIAVGKLRVGDSSIIKTGYTFLQTECCSLMIEPEFLSLMEQYRANHPKGSDTRQSIEDLWLDIWERLIVPARARKEAAEFAEAANNV